MNRGLFARNGEMSALRIVSDMWVCESIQEVGCLHEAVLNKEKMKEADMWEGGSGNRRCSGGSREGRRERGWVIDEGNAGTGSECSSWRVKRFVSRHCTRHKHKPEDARQGQRTSTDKTGLDSLFLL